MFVSQWHKCLATKSIADLTRRFKRQVTIRARQDIYIKLSNNQRRSVTTRSTSQTIFFGFMDVTFLPSRLTYKEIEGNAHPSRGVLSKCFKTTPEFLIGQLVVPIEHEWNDFDWRRTTA